MIEARMLDLYHRLAIIEARKRELLEKESAIRKELQHLNIKLYNGLNPQGLIDKKLVFTR